MPDRDPSLALVLSGGGARGAFDAGVVEAFDEAGLWPSLQTRVVLRPRFDLHRLVRLRALLQPPHHLFGFGGGSTTETLLDLIGWTWFFHLRPLRELLVDLLGGERLPLEDDVALALATIEVDSEPIEVDGSRYWDGGLTSNTPLTAALAHDPERLPVAGASTEEPGVAPPESLGDVLALALDHVRRAAMMDDIDQARTVSGLVGNAPDATHHHQVGIATVLPEQPVAGIGDLLDFEPEVARRLVTSGRRVTPHRLEVAGWN